VPEPLLCIYARGIARLPRIEIAEGVYHVVARGSERQAIFSDTADRERFLEIAAGCVRRYRLHVLAYCLMTNHYHLLVQTPDANLARSMRQLNGVYAQAFNRRHGRDGHLFQGRYAARLVQADQHLLAVVRYIVRNPLAAGMCERLDEWRWSSHRQTLGLEPRGLVSLERLFDYFGGSRVARRAQYLELVECDEGRPLPDHPVIAGDDEFVAVHLGPVPASPEFPRAALRLPRPPLSVLVASAADEAAVARAYLEHGYSMRELATHLGCGVATVHRRVRSFEARDGTWKT
jgi:REP element-mobilizing transposase RayT